MDLQLFDQKGNFREDVDLSGLDAEHVERAERVRETQRAVKAAEQELADATATVNATIGEIADLERFARARWPVPTFHDLWRENFGPQLRQ